MPKLPECSGDPACARDAFLLHADRPYCRRHFEQAGGVL